MVLSRLRAFECLHPLRVPGSVPDDRRYYVAGRAQDGRLALGDAGERGNRTGRNARGCFTNVNPAALGRSA